MDYASNCFSGAFTVQHRTLAILEILELIFEFVPRDTLKNCALVCRDWREPALKVFLHNMDNEADIWNLLVALLVEKRQNCQCGSRIPFHLHNGENPSDADWKRYFNRARAVRSISISPQEIRARISDEILVLLSSLPPELGRALPRLSAVRLDLCVYDPVDNPWHYVGNFLHEGIRDLTLGFEGFEGMEPFTGEESDEPEFQTAYAMILEVPSLTEKITHLTIDMPDPEMLLAFQEALTATLPHMHTLQFFTATLCQLLTPSIVASMKTLGCLTSIVSSQQRSRLQCMSGTRLRPTNKGGAYYPSLEYLQLYGSLTDIWEIFSDEQLHFPRLTSLRLDVETTRKVRIRDVIGAISSYADNLEFLTVVFMHTPNQHTQDAHIEEGVNRPLQVLGNLRTLKVYTNNRTSYSEAHLAELIGHMPNLLRLFVMPRKIYDEAPSWSPRSSVLSSDEEECEMGQNELPSEGLDLIVLKKFATIPNNLQFITIPLRSSRHISRQVWPIGPHLRRLRKLTLKSPLRLHCESRPEDVAHFLANVLPSRCEIRTLKSDHWSEGTWSSILLQLHHHRLGLPVSTSRKS